MMTDKFFKKKVPVCIKTADNEQWRNSVEVTVELHNLMTPLHKKELIVRLTDEKDLFFLFVVAIGEEIFQSLKAQQGLLVDFGTFPHKFIDLLELCLQEKENSTPRFVLNLLMSSVSPCDRSAVYLNVVETNPFKHLTHLSLKLQPGTDAEISKYLAACLKNIQEEKQNVESHLQMLEAELNARLKQMQQALSDRTQELDNLRTEWAVKSSTMSNKHLEEIQIEREKADMAKKSAQERNEREKRDLEKTLNKKVSDSQIRLGNLERNNKDLLDTKYKLEATVKELKSRISTSDEDYHRCKQDLQILRKQHSTLDVDCREKEKHVNQLKTRIAVLQQELKDKEQLLSQSEHLLQSNQQQKEAAESNAEQKSRQIVKLEVSVKSLSSDLNKANDIIRKLQGEIRTYHAKLKLQNQITSEQEKLLAEKDQSLEDQAKETELLKSGNLALETEKEKLNEQLKETRKKLENSEELQKKNENIIYWMHKQLADAQITWQSSSNGSRTSKSRNVYPTDKESLEGGALLTNLQDNMKYAASLGPLRGPLAQVQYHHSSGTLGSTSSNSNNSKKDMLAVADESLEPQPLPQPAVQHSRHNVNKENDPLKAYLRPASMLHTEQKSSTQALQGHKNNAFAAADRQHLMSGKRSVNPVLLPKPGPMTHQQPPLASAYFPQHQYSKAATAQRKQ